ncbi:hypothetical protein [Natrinema salsiterrestre]|uniref:Uncharacterized protein n=1 Tax=Natrinema salsiterrestre TaxID=2950540 RepID=A0A9Q4L380_9EURY|nr:hypothetical protein [Natrinema salsiterrestre]MDF9746038.1 hypothetical protein [Natrinema salsiterrestre]
MRRDAIRTSRSRRRRTRLEQPDSGRIESQRSVATVRTDADRVIAP